MVLSSCHTASVVAHVRPRSSSASVDARGGRDVDADISCGWRVLENGIGIDCQRTCEAAGQGAWCLRRRRAVMPFRLRGTGRQPSLLRSPKCTTKLYVSVLRIGVPSGGKREVGTGRRGQESAEMATGSVLRTAKQRPLWVIHHCWETQRTARLACRNTTPIRKQTHHIVNEQCRLLAVPFPHASSILPVFLCPGNFGFRYIGVVHV